MSVLSALRLTKAPAAAFGVVGLFWGSFAAQIPVIKAQIGASDAVFGLALLGTAIGLLTCLLYTSPSPRDRQKSRMPSSA